MALNCTSTSHFSFDSSEKKGIAIKKKWLSLRFLIAMDSSQLDVEPIYDYRVCSCLQIALHGHRTPPPPKVFSLNLHRSHEQPGTHGFPRISANPRNSHMSDQTTKSKHMFGDIR